MKGLMVLLCVFCALFAVGMVRAANVPDPTLDATASQLSGHPVSVWCETDVRTWVSLMDQQGDPQDADAFTVIGQPVIYLGPTVCLELRAIVQGEDVGAFLAAQGILDLAHEAVHQRGVTDEGATDCTALTLVRQTALDLGIPAKVRQTYVGQVWRRINGKRVRVPQLRHRTVSNPFLTKLQRDAQRWHAARPPAYHGSCG